MKKTNTEPYVVTYLHSKGRRLGLPIAGNFELTARCNFHCPMCYVHMTEDQLRDTGKNELTAAQWLDIARTARDRGMVFALLTGGEPLVRKDFFEIYDGMQQMGILVSVNSNGSLLRGDILERFLKTPPNRFNISLYGGSEDTYEKMCGRPVYHQVKENIRALRQAGVDVSLNLSITPWNCRDLDRIYADAEELDVNVRASSYMYPPIRLPDGSFGCGNRLDPRESARYGVKWDSLRYSREEFALRAENLAARKGLQPEGCPVEEGEGVRCRAGSSSFWLTWDGRMLPCGMMTTPSVNLLEVGFDAAWEQIRRATAEIRTPASCVDCGYKDICGACAAVYYSETGRFDAVPEYVCRRAEAIVAETARVYKERNDP